MDCIYLNFHFLAAFNDGSDFKYPSTVIIFTWLKRALDFCWSCSIQEGV